MIVLTHQSNSYQNYLSLNCDTINRLCLYPVSTSRTIFLLLRESLSKMSVLIAGLSILSGDSSSITEIFLWAICFLDTARVVYISQEGISWKGSASWHSPSSRATFMKYLSNISINQLYWVIIQSTKEHVKSSAIVSTSLSLIYFFTLVKCKLLPFM